MNEIEEKFYKTFGIEPQDYYACDWDSDCPYPEKQCGDTCSYWKKYKTEYPEITDRILYKIIELLPLYDHFIELSYGLNPQAMTEHYYLNIEHNEYRYHAHDGDLRTTLLRGLMLIEDNDVKTEIQSLFTEGEE